MTVEELKALNLPIEANAITALYVGAAIDWLKANTTLELNAKTLDESTTSELGKAVLGTMELGTEGKMVNSLPESIAALPDGAKLFICAYCDIMSADGRVQSESIGGMSQSYRAANKTTLLYETAIDLLGSYLKGMVRSIGNVSKWV